MISIKPILITSLLACVAAVSSSCADRGAEAQESSNTDEVEAPPATVTIAAMVADCAACAEDRAARHAESPLYQRLGGNETIAEFVAKLIELHMQNDVVSPFFKDVDQEMLATHLVNFIGAGTGGPETYEGRTMVASHAGMGVTPEVFLSAGGDIGTAMQAVGWGADEQQEFMCIILSMKDDVLMKSSDDE